MKKIFTILTAAVTALAFTACQQKELVQYDSANGVAPVLNTIAASSSTALVEGETYATVTYSAANYDDVSVPIQYTLYVDVDPTMSNPTKLYSVRNETSIDVLAKDLNNALLGYGASADDDVPIYFQVVAEMYGESSAIANTALKSNIVSTSVVTYDAEILYDRVYLPGSANGWDHSACQHLFNYSGDQDTYVGVADFGEDHAENQFKVTGAASWDSSTGNWGVADASTLSGEDASVQLLNDSNDNITVYTTYRYYIFSFSKSSLLLTMIKGFNQVSVIGGFDGWASDFVMTQDPYRQRFYVDLEGVEAGTEFKFRFDGAWDYNLGGDVDALSNGGDNLVFDEAGNYRVYLDLNDPSAYKAWWNTKDYGAEITDPYSTGTDEPDEPYEGWGIIGDFNEWNADVEMTESDGVWTGTLTVDAATTFKLRKDASWTENVGGPEMNYAYYSEENDVYQPTLGTAFTTGGYNIWVDAGSWDITYDTTAGTITVAEAAAASTWSLIGVIEDSNWSTDYVMKQLSSGLWVSDPVTINGEFKIRYAADWADNRGGSLSSLGEAFAVEANGANIAVPETGVQYQVIYNPSLETITVNPVAENWSVIGVYEGTNWDTDLFLSPKSDGTFESEVFKAEGDIKIRYEAAWDTNRGGTFSEVGEAFAVEQGGANISGLTGHYIKLVYDPSAETITVKIAWSLIGNVEDDSSWGVDYFMTETSAGVWEAGYTINGEFKLRYDCGWDTNRGGTLSDLGEAFAVENGGANIAVPTTGVKYRIVYDSNAETITVSEF